MKEYKFMVNNIRAYYTLVGLCVLGFFLILALWIALVLLTGWSMPYAVVLAVAIPVVSYYLLRRRTATSGTAILSTTHVEFKVKGVTEKIMFTDIASYSADLMQTKDNRVAGLRIRLKNGKKLRHFATSDLCNIEPLTVLCQDFDRLAKELNIESKFLSW